jgi:DNA-binding transcriptional regulator YhcF (GntR family)
MIQMPVHGQPVTETLRDDRISDARASAVTNGGGGARGGERHHRLVQLLRGRILRGLQAGTLRIGDRVPSGRELERELDVDHRLVLAAYRDLAGEGLVELRARGGIYVARELAPEGRAVPSESWLVELLAEAVAREVPAPSMHEWLRRATSTVRLRVAVVHEGSDGARGLAAELAEFFGLEVTAAGIDALAAEQLPPELLARDLIVTIPELSAAVEARSAELRAPVATLAVEQEALAVEWRPLLAAGPVYVVTADEHSARRFERTVAREAGAANLRTLVVGRDDLAEIPADAPTYVTRCARERLDGGLLPGRPLPRARFLTAESRRELLRLIVRANLRAADALAG